METLEFTIFDHGRQSIDALRSCLDEFGTKNRVNVQLEVLPWDGSWSKLVQIALYGGGPDLSEMSSTWIGDFVQMNTLRPYTGKEVAALGGESAFWEPAWASGGIHHDARFTLWGMPWLADARILVYRRDLFEQAGTGKPCFVVPNAIAVGAEQTPALFRNEGVPDPPSELVAHRDILEVRVA